MATTKPRITITLTERQHHLLKTISDASGNSMSYLVTDLIEASEPILERTASTFSHLKELNEENKRKIKQAMENAQNIIEPMAINALQQMDCFIDTLNEIHGSTDQPAPNTNRGDTKPKGKVRKASPAKDLTVVSKKKDFKKSEVEK
jgi:uncharacterized protein (DUF1778 family)